MRRLTSFLVVLVLCGLPAAASASFHFLIIEEVFFGTAADPTAQYVLLRDPVGGQNFVAGHDVLVQDASGAALPDFGGFAQSPPNGAVGSYIIIGTASAQALFGIPFDAVATGSLPFPSGRICFDVSEVDCIAYGAYTGGNGVFGSPAPAAAAGQALARITNTDANNADFVACAPHPFNNAGQSGGASMMFCNVCPNGYQSAPEACDDGNSSNTDECVTGCVLSSCGDGFVRAGIEQCDNGAANSNTTPNACRSNCTNARCGDGVTDNGEQCDNGSANSNTTPNACRSNCLSARCGDGVVDNNEQCDRGSANSNTMPNACRTTCVNARCGDNVIDTGEACDDGNTTAGDGCSPICVSETCGDGVVGMSEQCDNGPNNSDTTPDACRTSCLNAFCGDTVTDTGESCDDGNMIDTDTCVAGCVAAACGDGFVQEGIEECDPPNGTTCEVDCTVHVEPDAGVEDTSVEDTGVATDAGASDRGTAGDAAGAADTLPGADAAGRADAQARVDAGLVSSSKGSCSCDASRGTSGSPATTILFILGMLVVRRSVSRHSRACSASLL